VLYLVFKLSKSSKKLKEKTVEQSTLLSLFDIGDTVLFKWTNDEKYSIDYVSSNVENLLGFKKEEFLSNTVNYLSCIHKEDIQRVENEVKENKNSFFRHAPYRLITKDEKVKWVIDYTVLIKNDKNEITHYLGYLLDITKEKNIQDTLEKLIDSQNNIICLSNGKEISFANKKFYEFFKCNTIKEFQDRYDSLKSLFVENDRFFHLGKIKEDEFWMEKIKDFPENERIVAISDSSFNICAFSVNSNRFDEDLYLISFTDISETVLEQIKLEEKTIHDKLTGAYNREYFDIKYKSKIEDCINTNKYLAIAILDLYFFKKINSKNRKR
jgi:PAS domain S-box-containing protein